MESKIILFLAIIMFSSCFSQNKRREFIGIYENEYKRDISEKNVIFYIPYPTCESCYIAITNKLKTILPEEDQLIIVSDQRFKKANIFIELESNGYDIIYDKKHIAESSEYSKELIIPSIVLLNDKGVDTIIQVNSLNVDQVFDFVFNDKK